MVRRIRGPVERVPRPGRPRSSVAGPPSAARPAAPASGPKDRAPTRVEPEPVSRTGRPRPRLQRRPELGHARRRPRPPRATGRSRPAAAARSADERRRRRRRRAGSAARSSMAAVAPARRRRPVPCSASQAPKTRGVARPIGGVTSSTPTGSMGGGSGSTLSPTPVTSAAPAAVEEERHVRADAGASAGSGALGERTRDVGRAAAAARRRRRSCRRPARRAIGMRLAQPDRRDVGGTAHGQSRRRPPERRRRRARSTRLPSTGQSGSPSMTRLSAAPAPRRSAASVSVVGEPQRAGTPSAARGSRRPPAGDRQGQVDLGRRARRRWRRCHGGRVASPAAGRRWGPSAADSASHSSTDSVWGRRSGVDADVAASAASMRSRPTIGSCRTQHVVEHLAALAEARLDQPPQVVLGLRGEAARPGRADEHRRVDLRRRLERGGGHDAARRARRRGTGRTPRGSSCRPAGAAIRSATSRWSISTKRSGRGSSSSTLVEHRAGDVVRQVGDQVPGRRHEVRRGRGRGCRPRPAAARRHPRTARAGAATAGVDLDRGDLRAGRAAARAVRMPMPGPISSTRRPGPRRRPR